MAVTDVITRECVTGSSIGPNQTCSFLFGIARSVRVWRPRTSLSRNVVTRSSKTPLKTERLARAVFEGIPPRGAKDGEARVTMTVRQDLPLVIHPKGIPLEREPWKLLKIRVAGGELVIENPSPYVVRLAQAAQFQPGNEGVELPRPYVLPETTVKVPLNGNPGAPTALRLFPATLYGFAVESFDAPLVQAQAAK